MSFNENAGVCEHCVFIPILNKNINITEEISVITENDVMVDGINAFKETILSTIEKLYDTIDFFKGELQEKNNIIKYLISCNENVVSHSDKVLLEKYKLKEVIETRSSFVTVDACSTENNNESNSIFTNNTSIGSIDSDEPNDDPAIHGLHYKCWR